MSYAHTRDDWFDTIEAWPRGENRAGTELARAVTEAGLVGLPDTTAHPYSTTHAHTPHDLLSAAPLQQQPRRRWHLFLIPAGVVVGVVLIVGGLTTALLRSAGPEPVATDPAAPAAPSSSTATGADAVGMQCPSRSQAGVTTGADAGDQNSGPGVIKAFNYAYYVTRDAVRAAGVALVGAVATPAEMQTFIDERPRGTKHCLRITDRGEGSYEVELTEAPPGEGTPTVYRQIIETTEAQGKTWIVEIRPNR